MKIDAEGFVEVEVGGKLQRRRAIVYRDREQMFGISRVVPEVYSGELLVERIGMDPIVVRVSE